GSQYVGAESSGEGVPGVEGNAQRRSAVAGRWLDKDLPKRSLLPDEAIRHAVISHSAREAQIRRARVPVKRVENSEEMRLQAFLQRGSDVPVVLGDFFMRQTRRAENLGELVRINSADVRFFFISD